MAARAAVVLYGKDGCHLCDDAAAILQRLGRELGIAWTKVDITSDAAIFERFRYRIPVIEVVGGQMLDWPTTAHRVRQAVLAVR